MANSKQTQKSGNNSTNIQIETVVNGLSYSDAKMIFNDLYKANFLQLAKEAGEIASTRSQEFIENFLSKALEKKILLDEVKNPGFEYSFFEAQKTYAKTGDKDMEDVLIDILIDRLSHIERDLKQIVLDESILVIPKLLPSQLDTLTVIFLLKETQNTSLLSHDKLKEYLNLYLIPFIKNLSKERSLYQHLEFVGCGNVSIGSISIENIFKKNYQGLFFEGFNEEYFNTKIGKIEEYKEFLIPSLIDNTKFQQNTLTKEMWMKAIKAKGLEDIISQRLIDFFDKKVLPDEEIKSKLIELGGIDINNLFELWNESNIKNTTLTTVGIAIAHANFRRKTGITFDLSIWIK